MYKFVSIALLVAFQTLVQGGMAQNVTQYRPTHEEMVRRYERAAVIDSLTRNVVFKSTVDAHWLQDGKAFWYYNLLQDSIRQYRYVDAATGKKSPAFDEQKLSAGLRLVGIQADPQRLMVRDMLFPTDKNTVQLNVNGQWVACNLSTYACTKISAPRETSEGTGRGRGGAGGRFRDARNGGISPDKQWEAYIEQGNVFIKPVAGGTPVQYTSDGSTARPYGSLSWSPDSKYLAGYLIHPVRDSSVYHILTSLPGTTRGQLRSQPYKQPGDPFTSYTMYLFPVEAKKAVKVDAEPIDFRNAPQFHWRGDDNRYFTYEKLDRGHQRFRVIEVDAGTGETREIVDEKTNTFIYADRIFTYYLPGARQMIRISEKDGWRHIYLADLITGKEQPVTRGNWVVRGIDSIDAVKKQVWFTASGMNTGEDPYHIHYYTIGFDGKGLRSLTPEPGHHTMQLAPGGAYYLHTYSQVNVAPITKLRRTADVREVLQVEEADLSLYKKSGVNPPEVFVAKARDGVTDIWGIVSRPSDYDPNKKYPVLENIYAGPHDSFVPKSFTPYSEMQSLAELGFIVVMIDGMGTANRSKAFHDVCWKNIADAGFPDRKLWIQALARKYAYVDAERVGIYGTSAGGQNTLGALLFHPDFYKAGVSACGCHDNRVDKQWWNEQWMGYPVGKHYDDQSNVTHAAKLKGNLLLIVGEADTNVPPESSYRVADELIKARKNFDFLSIPGMGHSDGGVYGRIRKRDFFVKHLLEVDPPGRNEEEWKPRAEVGRERWSFQ